MDGDTDLNPLRAKAHLKLVRRMQGAGVRRSAPPQWLVVLWSLCWAAVTAARGLESNDRRLALFLGAMAVAIAGQAVARRRRGAWRSLYPPKRDSWDIACGLVAIVLTCTGLGLMMKTVYGPVAPLVAGGAQALLMILVFEAWRARLLGREAGR